ncbi:hypothetical protein GRJ2_001635200 [Grus japonensis]|uniref:Uncharacterized protein n=1 Tax=Grus japonensis TaxID=30415 RepID=A0ABC9X1Z5_GRUJA
MGGCVVELRGWQWLEVVAEEKREKWGDILKSWNCTQSYTGNSTICFKQCGSNIVMAEHRRVNNRLAETRFRRSVCLPRLVSCAVTLQLCLHQGYCKYQKTGQKLTSLKR